MVNWSPNNKDAEYIRIKQLFDSQIKTTAVQTIVERYSYLSDKEVADLAEQMLDRYHNQSIRQLTDFYTFAKENIRQ